MEDQFFDSEYFIEEPEVKYNKDRDFTSLFC